VGAVTFSTARATAAGASAQAEAEEEGWASAAWALRCLESIAGREGSFQLAPTAIASAAGAAEAVLAAPAPPAATAGAPVQPGAAAASAAAALLASLLRHRGRDMRRLAAPVVAGCRGLLALLGAWLAPRARGGGRDPACGGAARARAAAHCAEQLARVYQAVVDQKDLLGRCCHLLLADYVIWAAAAAAAAAAVSAGAPGGGAPGERAAADEAAGAAGAALRRGGHALYGAVGPAELQHVHAVVGQGPLGAARRAALAELRGSYEREFKYTGKT
jgi:hypothetical protein